MCRRGFYKKKRFMHVDVNFIENLLNCIVTARTTGLVKTADRDEINQEIDKVISQTQSIIAAEYRRKQRIIARQGLGVPHTI